MKSLQEVKAQVLSRTRPTHPICLPVADAYGFHLAEDVVSNLDLPRFDNSAMDGYAVVSSDFSRGRYPLELTLVGESPAGDRNRRTLQPGTCMRVFTGSRLPDGADAVIMQEDVRLDPSNPGKVVCLEGVKAWENVRFKAEDISKGRIIARRGARMDFSISGLLTACGVAEMKLHEAPRLGVMATGNELCEIGEELTEAGLFESNRVMISHLARSFGAAPRPYPIVGDSLEETVRTFERAFDECDLVVSTGGVSVGDYDLVKPAFNQLGGRIETWRVAIRPGKPLAFGMYKDRLFFGLPGNPVSAAVTCFLVVCPALLRMQGVADPVLPSMVALLSEPLENSGDRTHYVRVTIHEDGRVCSSGLQASHAMGSLGESDGLVEVPPGAQINMGERVRVWLWKTGGLV